MNSHQKISDTTGGFSGVLDDANVFGWSIAHLGDLDGDGVQDMAVGEAFDDDGGTNRGAVWILFMNTNGTVKSHQKISDTIGGFTGVLDDLDCFGYSITSLGDLDSDGINDIVVGAAGDDDGGNNRGAVWILFMNSNGTVKSNQKISDATGGFTGVLDDGDNFGGSVTNLGDLDSDGIPDMAAGVLSNDGGTNRGAVYVLFLNSDGTVKSHQKISDTIGGFTGILNDSDHFGYSSLSCLGDLDSDGINDIVVGAAGDDDGGNNCGAVWILFMNSNGTVKSHQKISDTTGWGAGVLDDGDNFGGSVTNLGDLDSDGIPDMAAGAVYDDDGGTNMGAVYILLLNNDGTVINP